MVLDRPGQPLWLAEIGAPVAWPGQIMVRVAVCDVGRRDLHTVDGQLPDPKLPIVPGHESVGTVGRIGIPWLGRTCEQRRDCRAGRETLRDEPGFTGYQIDGGYAEHACAAQGARV